MVKLEEYRRKRRFDRTPEPPAFVPARPAGGPQSGTTAGRPTTATEAASADRSGKSLAPAGNRFVVQKHSARRLHYDFRLEIDGVLKSWAVPKGPSLNPGDKRLAVQTEDHPPEYAQFEGVIPEGSYGAGTVMVWDRGTFGLVNAADAGQQLGRGELKFTLHGEKLRGGFVLVKLRHREKGNEWLLIKHRDAAADPEWNIGSHDGSVLTGRTLEEISERVPPKRTPQPISAEELPGARRAGMPARLEPMLATAVAQAFSDPGWLYEIKWDGVRTLAWLEEGRVELRSRTGRVVTQQYPELAILAECVRARRAILDGEIVVLDRHGRGDFERLAERMHIRLPSSKLLSSAPVTYYVFDLLYCDGYDLREAPLAGRKELLRRLLDARDPLRYSDHHPEQGKELFELAREQDLEGIIAKRAASAYTSGRSRDWLKLKTRKELDAVVCGWTAPRGSREHFGALLLGLYAGKRLRFIGHVGSGFDQRTQRAIGVELRQRAASRCPFGTAPETNERAHWVRPDLVARVAYSGWTQEQRLRHPVFLAVRTDKSPEDCQSDGEVAVEASPAVVAAPALAGKVLARRAQIEAELFRGREENVTIEIEGRRLRLANLNKVFFPESGYTKRDLLAYYCRIAGRLLPFLRDRPLVLRRYPDGITGTSFFQKDAGEAVPEWLETLSLPSEGQREEVRYVIANDLAALLYLTNLGCIDHNPWSSRSEDLEHPDYFFFDLDPAEGTDFAAVVSVARALYAKLRGLGLKVFLKTSGATGMHLYLPLERQYTYEQVRMFGEIVARLVAAEIPGLITQERSVARRAAGKVYIDVSQNAYGRPLAAPYVVRAFPGAPVSAPMAAREVRRGLRPEKLNLKTILARLKKQGDPWEDFWKSRQRIEAAAQLLGKHLPGNSKG